MTSLAAPRTLTSRNCRISIRTDSSHRLPQPTDHLSIPVTLSATHSSPRFTKCTKRLSERCNQRTGVNHSRASFKARHRTSVHAALEIDPPSKDKNVSPAPNKRVVEVDGRQCELLEFPATCSCSRNEDTQCIVVVPGNPGMVSYYSDFACALWCEKKGRHDVYVLGYLGHSEDYPPLLTKPPDDEAVFSLRQQNRHVVSFLKEHIFNTYTGGCTLVGHSIGAHVALEALAVCDSSAIKGVVGVHPFLTSMTLEENKEQSFLNMLVHMWPVVALARCLVWLVSKLPQKMQSWLLTPSLQGMGLDSNAVNLTLKALVRPKAFHNMLYMGRTEFDDLRGDPDRELLLQHKHKVGFIFGKNDIWAPDWLRVDIEATVPGIHVRQEPKHSHMFSVTQEGSRDIAKLTAEMIQSFHQSQTDQITEL